jgi:hypothetical protein
VCCVFPITTCVLQCYLLQSCAAYHRVCCVFPITTCVLQCYLLQSCAARVRGQSVLPSTIVLQVSATCYNRVLPESEVSQCYLLQSCVARVRSVLPSTIVLPESIACTASQVSATCYNRAARVRVSQCYPLQSCCLSQSRVLPVRSVLPATINRVCCQSQVSVLPSTIAYTASQVSATCYNQSCAARVRCQCYLLQSRVLPVRSVLPATIVCCQSQRSVLPSTMCCVAASQYVACHSHQITTITYKKHMQESTGLSIKGTRFISTHSQCQSAQGPNAHAP